MERSKDYRDYVIKDGRFIGKFEEMYQNVDDPWEHGEAKGPQYAIALHLLDRYNVKPKTILDIGCGKGAFTHRINKIFPDAKIYAVDISETAIKKAKQTHGNENIEFGVMDINKSYNELNGKYDLIIMSQIMWYVLPQYKDIMAHLREQNLEKGGKLLTIQTFYPPETQKYGKEIASRPKDMHTMIGMKIIDSIDVHKIDWGEDFDSVGLYER